MDGYTGRYEYFSPRELEYALSPVSEVSKEVLMWIQAQPLRAAYELWAGDRVCATLRFKSLVDRKAIAASYDDLWTFQNESITGEKVIISQQSGIAGTILHQNELVDAVAMKSGDVYLWTRLHAFKNEYAFLDVKGKELIAFTPESSLTARTRVHLMGVSKTDKRISLLALLGFYLTLIGNSIYDRSKSSGE